MNKVVNSYVQVLVEIEVFKFDKLLVKVSLSSFTKMCSMA